MTNFFEQQRLAKSKSRKIIFTFVVFLGLQFAAVYYILSGFVFPQIVDHQNANDLYDYNSMNSTAIEASLVFAFIFVLMFVYKRLSFLHSPSQIPQAMGAILVLPNTEDPQEKVYYNIVSEMALASGIPMPEIYVIKQELAINAFTSGHNHQNANVVVTQGALNEFTRDELQAVVAHEFGHIVSGDVRSNIELLSVAFSFSALFTVGYYFLRLMGSGRRRRSSSKNGGGGQLIVIAIGIMIFGAIGSFVSRIISSMFSRQREYLADALSVQFTRYPAGLGSALAKIRDNSYGSVLASANGAEVSSICFGSSITWMSSVFDTHPPVDERIKKVDKAFLELNSSFVKEKAKERKESAHKNEAPNEKSLEYLASIGLLSEQEIKNAEKVLSAVEESPLKKWLTPYYVEPLVYALFINEDEQLKVIEGHSGLEVSNQVKEIMGILSSIPVVGKFSVVELLVPLFSQVSASVSMRMIDVSKSLVKFDGQVDAYESFLYLYVKKYNYGLEGDSKTPSPVDLMNLISSMASLNGEDEAVVKSAQSKALKDYFGKEISHSVDAKVNMELIFYRLSKLSLKNKEKLVKALMTAITFDEHVNRQEFEAFRIVCDAMEVPAPPIQF